MLVCTFLSDLGSSPTVRNIDPPAKAPQQRNGSWRRRFDTISRKASHNTLIVLMVAALEDGRSTVEVLCNAMSMSRAFVCHGFVHDTKAINKWFQLGKKALLDLGGKASLVVELLERK